jgi:sulfoacetaldehyde dehydrogenase
MAVAVREMYGRARAAFKEVESWPQAKVDEMVAAVGWEWQKEETRKALARLAIDESGIGVYEDKVQKIWNKTRGTLRDFRGVKTCGLVGEDRDKGLRIFAKPIGVVGSLIPCTNPESTVCCLGLSLLKTRNAMMVSPHPRTTGSTHLTVEYGRRALRKIGAPEDLLQCIEQATHEGARELMAQCDFVVATGGAALVKVVYAAAKPAHTVGAGNVISVVDETADVKAAAAKIAKSKTANNSVSCSSENAVAVEGSRWQDMLEALRGEGGYLCSARERDSLAAYMWPDGRHLNRELVGQPAPWIAKQAGIEAPDGTRFLVVPSEHPGPEDPFCWEKLSLVLTAWKWDDFNVLIERATRILHVSGEGHSISIHSENEDRRVELAVRLNVGRVICNMPHAAANSGGWSSGLPTTDSLGCGTWAGNMTSENIHWKHFLNYTWLATPIEEHIPGDDELFGDYLRKWGRD